MNLFKKVLLLILIFAFVLPINAQEAEADSTKPKMFDWFLFPYALYSPETSFAFGGAGIIYFRTSKKKNTKPSKINMSAYYTVNHQFSTFMTPSIYFDENKNELAGELYFAHKIDKFYGAGSNSEEISNPQYDFQIAQAIVKFKREIYESVKITINYEFEHYKIKDPKENPFFNDPSIPGISGGNNSGIGFGFNYDNRDNLFFPSSGTYFDLYSLFFLNFLGSDFKYNEFIFDARHYQSINSKDRVIALQLYSAITTGETPFYSMPTMGGAWMMRGYYNGRYRDKTFSTAQIEFRDEFFWKLGVVVFAGVGDVGSSLGTYKLTQLKYSYGFGLRYMLDTEEKINIRFDMGFGHNTSGIYFGIEEAF